MRKESKTIEVDFEVLTELIVDSCPHLIETVEMAKWCQKKRDASCRVSLHERANCPRDCPHMNEEIKWSCDMKQCAYVKKTIKKLKSKT